MGYPTRLTIDISNFIVIIQNKFLYEKNDLPIKLFLLFMGFLIGSLFGTFLPNFPEEFNSHSVSIVLLIITIELINCLVYSSEQRKFRLCPRLENLFQYLMSRKSQAFFFFRAETQKEERINKFKKRSKLRTENKKRKFYRDLNSFKVGIMLGFFIDAFKVGS